MRPYGLVSGSVILRELLLQVIYDALGCGAGVGEDYIHVGANGRCETTVDATGTQPIPVGQGIPNATAITGGANGMIDTETLSADDTRVGGEVTVSGVTDVGGNTIRTTGDEYFSDGSVR